MAKITIEGKDYKVTESLGFQGGYYAKYVETPEGVKVSVKRGGVWTWWTVRDKIAPRGEHVGMSNTEYRTKA